jgi:hypothetical protein
MSDHVQRFLERFADFGAAPDPDKYERLFDPEEGTVLHPGMRAPLRRDQVRAYMTTYLAGVPEFRFDIAEWAERGDTVFVEARNSGRPGGGEVLEWGMWEWTNRGFALAAPAGSSCQQKPARRHPRLWGAAWRNMRRFTWEGTRG